MRYFPSDPDARTGIAKQIAAMASSIEQVRWLVGRLPELYPDWPAMQEVRALFCSRFRPKDGLEAASQVYLDGIPHDPALQRANQAQLAGQPILQLEGECADETPIADPEMAAKIDALGKAKGMPALPPVEMNPGENDLQALTRQFRRRA